MAVNDLLYKRKYTLAGIAIIIVLIYIGQLFYLQIIKNEYKDSADNNAFFKKTLYPARGTISDRQGRLLVYNRPTFDVVYIPREVTANFDTLDFCNTLGITKEQFDARIKDIKDMSKNPGYSTYTQQTFTTQLSIEQCSLLQEKLYKFPGFFIQNRTERQYSYPNAGLLLGYVAEVNRSQMAEDEYYARGDYGGKSGIELSYEKLLRGEKGIEISLRDARGRIQGRYEQGKFDKAPVSGKNLKLSIDIELQAYGEYLMQNKIGSIIMIEPSTGEILCMVTSPSYDPSMLLGKDYGKNYSLLEKNPLKPLYNRAIQGMYPPGSTFKTTQGLIFLQEGIITPGTMYSCAHGFPVLGGRPACHAHASPLSLVPAIATSCNSYFCYGLMNMLHNKKYGGVTKAFDIWKDHMVDQGFGYKVGIDLPYERRGFIPNSEYYSTHLKTTNWKAANVISIAIGQGEILATPLQVANLAATIANRGFYYAPHVVKEIENTPLDSIYTHPHSTKLKKEYYEYIVEGMSDAVTGGTCRRINIPGLDVCGKTGTAENPHGKDHSIFMGFAPKNAPKVSIFVLIENGGFGATYAVPIARLMVEKYMLGEVPEGDKGLEIQLANTSILPSSFVNWRREKTVVNIPNEAQQSEEKVETIPVIEEN